MLSTTQMYFIRFIIFFCLLVFSLLQYLEERNRKKERITFSDLLEDTYALEAEAKTRAKE